ncbi:hypothetical protein ANSO36C_67760 (plasmid) [Nostoc cf. commune SO-36]|uniref:Uncharacterized protein n=1 Tax=Nostoc cf. commune SO-36 TaxID=449208 RepID=A0ABM7ZCG8_NOSCO|nr:hypothetical protein ANSO36C_67760 [Nostoc cf. commune SO-36]
MSGSKGWLREHSIFGWLLCFKFPKKAESALGGSADLFAQRLVGGASRREEKQLSKKGGRCPPTN